MSPPSTPIGLAAAATLALLLSTPGCAWFARQARPEPPAATPAPRPNTPAAPSAELWVMPEDPSEAEPALRALLVHAKEAKLPVAIAGARQSLGGQAFAPGGIVVDMRLYRGLSLDAKARVLTVRAGTRWKEVLPYLHQQGLSPMVMQATNDFSVGGSLSANCHGLQPGAPMAQSVLSFKLMLADGRVVTCSRSERSELFKLAIGGYGLFGVILEARLRVVPNARYRLQRHFVKAEAFAQTFATHGANAALAYGRLSVAPGSFLREAILTLHAPAPGKFAYQPLPDPAPIAVNRLRYWRDAIRSPGGKLALWEAEKRADTGLRQDYATRNELLNAAAEDLAAVGVEGTLVRQTYFLPRPMLAAFIAHARQLLPDHQVDLLEAGVVAVSRDDETVLRYADQPMFALTLVFHQARNDAAEADMAKLTQDLNDAALALSGRFYLPYRLHATTRQFRLAYPQSATFFAAKRRYDPDERFQSQFYLKYGQAP
ncbi:MAG: FAD-dependent oxidoreductase [Candidatus Sericytochromatia bacterium]